MKNLQLFAFGSGALFLAGALMLAACSEDTVVTPLDPDGGVDASGDGSKPDSSADGGTDSGTDSSTDAGLTLDTYVLEIGEALCSSLTRCCFGDPNVPDGGPVTGGTFSEFACVNAQKALGFESTNVNADVLTAGNYTLDQAQAADCLAKVKSFQCELTGASLKEIRAACFAAIQGKTPIGSACRASIECAAGAFCKPDDGKSPLNGGKCEALRGLNGNCGDIYTVGTEDDNQQAAEEACSSRGAGDTGLHCDSFDYAGTNDYRPRSEWKCKPAVATGAGCSSTVWCSDGICDPGTADAPVYVCKNPLNYTALLCDDYVVK